MSPQKPLGSGVSRREFVTAAAASAAAFMIVPRHVLGRGFQAPSDLVNVAVAGINGQGAANARTLMSQNIVAICDCDLALLDARLQAWKTAAERIAAPPGQDPNAGIAGRGQGGRGQGGRGQGCSPARPRRAGRSTTPASPPCACTTACERSIPPIATSAGSRT
jgi:hypothetical protein